MHNRKESIELRVDIKPNYILEKRSGDDPDFKVAEEFSQMPRDKVYDEAVRMYTVMIQKAKNYGYLDSRGRGLEEDVLHFYSE